MSDKPNIVKETAMLEDNEDVSVSLVSVERVS